MNGLLLIIALAAAPKPEPLKLASPGFTSPNLKPEEVSYYSEFFGNQLRLQGIKVITSSEIAAALGLERQRQLLGCTDDCGTTELVSQLGVDGIVQGLLGRFGEGGVQIDLKVLLASNGETVAARSVTAQNDVELYELLRRAAQEIAIELFHKLEKVPVAQVVVELQPPPGGAPSSQRSTVPGYIGIGLGVAAAAGGGVLMGFAKNQLSNVSNGGPTSYHQAQLDADQAKTMSTTGVVLLGAGAALAVLGIVYEVVVAKNDMLALGPYVGAGEGGLVLSGSFP